LLIIGFLGTALGLALVLGHQLWSGGALAVAVTVFGWVIPCAVTLFAARGETPLALVFLG
jgi:hypothetical protein